MQRYQISLIRPQGYVHSDAFLEVAETLSGGFRRLGLPVFIAENQVDPSATNIILGFHLLNQADVDRLPSSTVIYNLEQLDAAACQALNLRLDQMRRFTVWDYSLRNIKRLAEFDCAARHVPLGYSPELTRIEPAPEQDIDVLFYGSINERRQKVLDGLRRAGLNVHAAFGAYGAARDALIARAKVVLNVHFYDSQIFEIVRVSYLLANRKAVVSEYSAATEIDDDLRDGVVLASYDRLVDECVQLVAQHDARQALARRGFECMSARDEASILKAALESRAPLATTSAAPICPRKINMGSGKDWREDYLNIDINDYWKPDAVLDFGNPLKPGQTLETKRFGAVPLEENYFTEIIANDVLEHIPNLTTAMTTCLNLLQPGGVFRINVPYDLSFGAWQDPTHVRAFNERSWLYYTDWFWYLGWTKARFEIAQLDFGISEIGEALRKQGVAGTDLARQPRAIDNMKVALRKRLLTPQESAAVQRYLKRPDRA